MGRIPSHPATCTTYPPIKDNCWFCGMQVYKIKCNCQPPSIFLVNSLPDITIQKPKWDSHNCSEKQEYIKAQERKILLEEERLNQINEKYSNKKKLLDFIISLKSLDTGAITDKQLQLLKTKKYLISTEIVNNKLFVKLQNEKHVNGFCQKNIILNDFKFKKEFNFSEKDTIHSIVLIEYSPNLKQFISYEIFVSNNLFKVQKIKTGSYCEIHFNCIEVNEEYFLKAVSLKKYRKKQNYEGYEYVDLRK